MRIGFVTGEYPPMEGGVGAFTQELARALANAGHNIHVFTDRKARPPDAARANAARDWRALRRPIDQGDVQLMARARRWRWPFISQVADWVMRYELDVVNVQYQAAAYNMRSPAVNFLPWRLKGLVPTVVTFHDLRTPYLFPKVGWLREAAVHFMARQALGVIVTNHSDFGTLQGILPSSTALVRIPIGSNITAYTPNHIEIAEAREKFGLAETDFLLGYFGFLNESKGADTLLRALARLESHVHLVFIGGQTGSSDPQNNQVFLRQIEQLVRDLDLEARVHWTGFLPQKRVSAFLHAADMMVMPYRDGVSLRRGTLMAVLAHGRPLLTTRPLSPTPELVGGENVALVPADDIGALAEMIRRLAAAPQLRTKLGEGAVQVADLFRWEKIAAETAEFFAGLLDNA